jgi:hypothetical protein
LWGGEFGGDVEREGEGFEVVEERKWLSVYESVRG